MKTEKVHQEFVLDVPFMSIHNNPRIGVDDDG